MEQNNQEKETQGTAEGGFHFDEGYSQFPDIVRYRGQIYDARDSSKGDSCIYRMTAEHRMQLEEPDYIEVDREGNIIREWNG